MKSVSGHVAVVGALLFFATLGRAQFPGSPYGGGGFGGGFGGQFARPAVSPYLNILRGGDPAINYYGLVRPQIAFGRAFQALGNDVTALEGAANQPTQTGNRSSFMNHYRYFMNNGSGGGRQGRQGGGMQGGGMQGGGAAAAPAPRR